jgi:hypothetical protein
MKDVVIQSPRGDSLTHLLVQFVGRFSGAYVRSAIAAQIARGMLFLLSKGVLLVDFKISNIIGVVTPKSDIPEIVFIDLDSVVIFDQKRSINDYSLIYTRLIGLHPDLLQITETRPYLTRQQCEIAGLWLCLTAICCCFCVSRKNRRDIWNKLYSCLLPPVILRLWKHSDSPVYMLEEFWPSEEQELKFKTFVLRTKRTFHRYFSLDAWNSANSVKLSTLHMKLLKLCSQAARGIKEKYTEANSGKIEPTTST